MSGNSMANDELSGVQKAAILLIALGPEKSAAIFKHLKEDEIAFRHYKSDIRKMGVNTSNYTNYEKNNAYRPFQGGDCTGGK